MRVIKKPFPDEYPAYSEMYMKLIPDDGQVLTFLEKNAIALKELIYSLPEEKLYFRYSIGKWSIKEILVHLIDDERIFSYRALRYARNDDTPLHGFEENDYAKFSCANSRSLESIFNEYEAVRQSTILLFQYMPEEAFMRSGAGIDTDGSIINKRTVRALVYHIAGHEQRHINIIHERYLTK
jgi:uncharacterized damage-inducible protein DinB